MKVTNNASFPVIAFGIHMEIGYGDDVIIQPGESAEVSGPRIGEMGKCSCYIHLDGELVCHEASDDDNSFQIARGMPIFLQLENKGITIRHHEDPAEEHVLEWRSRNTD